MKQIIANYTFNATARTITLTDFTTVRLDRLHLIVDTTTNTILYNFADSSVATATVATNVITLSTVGSAASADKLQVVYDCLTGDPTYDTVPVSAASLPLPSGAATSAAQSAGNTSLSNIDTKTPALSFGRVPVDGSGVTQPVSASSLPLPTGAAQDGTDASVATQLSGGAGIRGWLSSLYHKLANAVGVHGSAIPSNGILMQGSDGTAARNVKTDTNGVMDVRIVTGTTNLTQSVDTNGDGTAAAVFTFRTAAMNFLFNGSTFDRYRGNLNTTTGDTGVKTATFNGATQTNHNARGASIVLNVGTVSGTSPTLVAKVQGSADGGTTWFDIPGAVTPTVSASGQYLLNVYPGVTPAANSAVSFPLPRTWRVVYTIGGTTPSFTLTNVQVAYTL